MKPVEAEVQGFWGGAWKDGEHWYEECPECDEGIADFGCCLCNGHGRIRVHGDHVRYGLHNRGYEWAVIDRFKNVIVSRFEKRWEAISAAHQLNYPQGHASRKERLAA